MSTHDICNTAVTFNLCRDLPQWINWHRPADARGRYHARELDHSFNGLPTLTVDMTGPRGPVAAYKCNITLVEDARRPWLVFSPLVVIWEMPRDQRGPGFGQAILDHSAAAIAGFCDECLPRLPDILIASGNLTTAKAGRPFFESVGWEIVVPGDCARYAADTGLMTALAYVARQIDTALAPLRESAPETVDPTSFAILRLPLAGIPLAAGLPAGACVAGTGAPAGE